MIKLFIIFIMSFMGILYAKGYLKHRNKINTILDGDISRFSDAELAQWIVDKRISLIDIPGNRRHAIQQETSKICNNLDSYLDS